MTTVKNGSQFISGDLVAWAYRNDVTLDLSRPGKPTDNSFIEAFSSKVRQECLSARWCLFLADAHEDGDLVRVLKRPSPEQCRQT